MNILYQKMNIMIEKIDYLYKYTCKIIFNKKYFSKYYKEC